MTTPEILISLSLIIVLSYIFDFFASKIKLPAVVLLLLLGVGLKLTASFLGTDVAVYESKIKAILPLLGTLGLIFIVLEGALELEINGSKKTILFRTLSSALIVLLGSVAVIWALLYYGFHQDMYMSMLNAVPLSVISSAIAIPSVSTLRGYEKEFVIFESSFSDIIGVMVFNFILTNAVINFSSFLHLGYELVLIIVISIVATICVGFLFEKLGQHKKFILLLAILILFYGIAKHFHLSALVLIFIFGLFAGNNEFFINRVLRQKFKMQVLQKEIHQFQSFIIEFAFVIRTFFFVIFGLSINFSGLMTPRNMLLAGIIVVIVFLIRFIYFRITKDDKDNLLWFVAPRGLITILLFFTIPDTMKLDIVNQDVLLLVILTSILVLALGSMLTAKKSGEEVLSQE
jgi:Kef-type K+ transport system membrane component KefB